MAVHPSRRKRPRLTLPVVAGVLLSAILAGAGWAWAGYDRGPTVIDRVATYSAAPPVAGSPSRGAGSFAAGDPPALSSAPTKTIVAVLGDSVPAGSSCNCPAFGDEYGQQIAATTRRSVTVNNLGTPRQTSEGLLASLSATGAAAVVAGADIVTITIGANDFAYSGYAPDSCPTLSCYGPSLQQMRSAVDALLDRIAALRAGRPTAVRVTGYWDIWKDGAVGRAQGKQYDGVGDALTSQVNASLHASALAHGAVYVDLFHAFRGLSGTDDDTSLLSSDGDHPNSSGHHQIAEALLRSGLSPLD